MHFQLPIQIFNEKNSKKWKESIIIDTNLVIFEKMRSVFPDIRDRGETVFLYL